MSMTKPGIRLNLIPGFVILSPISSIFEVSFVALQKPL